MVYNFYEIDNHHLLNIIASSDVWTDRRTDRRTDRLSVRQTDRLIGSFNSSCNGMSNNRPIVYRLYTQTRSELRIIFGSVRLRRLMHLCI